MTKGAEGRNKHRGLRQTHLSSDSGGIQKLRFSLPGLKSSAGPFLPGAPGHTRFSSVQLPESPPPPASQPRARHLQSSFSLSLCCCHYGASQHPLHSSSRDRGLYLEPYKDVRILVMTGPAGLSRLSVHLQTLHLITSAKSLLPYSLILGLETWASQEGGQRSAH